MSQFLIDYEKTCSEKIRNVLNIIYYEIIFLCTYTQANLTYLKGDKSMLSIHFNENLNAC